MKPNIQRLLSMLIALTGIILMLFMILVEDEPGAVPLLFIIAGSIWFFKVQARIKSQ
jgi:hypothetical protein